MTLRFHNSLTRKLESFESIEPDKVRMYTCGPTVYDRAHIGNFRAFLWEDLLRRYLRWKGFEVEQVMNLTDVDDKTIEAARERGVSLDEVTEPVIQMFLDDWTTLGLEEVEYRPRATEHVDGMIRLIESLQEKGLAYEVEGSMYFPIARFPGYGQLVNLAPDAIGNVGRVSGDEEYDKDDPRDFVLWKGSQGEEGPKVAVWESPWGLGRPGWHLECSAMAMQYLGETLDIHTGGVDNLFPHHTNEIAQSEGVTGRPFANFWLHVTHLLVEGRKMSKSLGNCFTVPDILEKGYAASTLRYLLLSGHHRTQLNFTFDGLNAAAKAMQRLYDFRQRLREALALGVETTVDMRAAVEATKSDFEAAMDEDLNVSEALGAVFRLVRDTNQFLDSTVPNAPIGAKDALSFLDDFEDVFGVLSLMDEEVSGAVEAGEEVIEWAKNQLVDRERAREKRDFEQADAIRASLEAKGVVVEDLAETTRLRFGSRSVVVPRSRR